MKDIGSKIDNLRQRFSEIRVRLCSLPQSPLNVD